jgi:hypothetical protein
MPLWEAKELAIVNTLGAPTHSRSHFDEISDVAYAAYGEKDKRSGWIARFLDVAGSGSVVQSVGIGSTTRQLIGGKAAPVNVESINNFKLDSIFGSIPRKFLGKPNFINTQPSLPWHIGVNFSEESGVVSLKFKDLVEIKPPLINAVSVITSNKNISVAHQQRLSFIYNLKKIMGPELHIFGRGINPISDKFEVLSKYRYHLALENNSQSDYWSEKIADPLIALNKVFYSGGDNINHYFSERAVELIDINNPVDAAQLMLESIRNNSWDRDLSIIRSEKLKILGEYNFVNIIKDLRVSNPTRRRKHIYGDVSILPLRILNKKPFAFNFSVDG